MTQQAQNLLGANPAVQSGVAGQLQTSVSSTSIDAATGVMRVRVERKYNKLHLELRVPIEFEGKIYKELIFREVKLSDLIIVQEQGETAEAMAEVFASMSGGVPATVVLDLPYSEYKLIQNFFTVCMGDLQRKV